MEKNNNSLTTKRNNLKTNGAREWSARSCNYQIGCRNNCHYCYARNMLQRNGLGLNWSEPTISKAGQKLLHSSKLLPLRDGIVMMPTSHDIDEHNIEQTLHILKRLKNNKVLLVTKARLDCIQKICEVANIENTEIRITIGSLKNEHLGLWEPQAPTAEERLECILYAIEKGFRVSISSEPMLDEPDEMIKMFRGIEHWLGTMNNLKISNLSRDVLKDYERIKNIQSISNLKRIYDTYQGISTVKFKDSFLSAL